MNVWKERDPNHKSYLTYGGELPPSLFRYRTVRPDTIDRLIDFEVSQEGIFLSALKDLNDPDEGRFRMRFASREEDIVSFFWRELRRSNPRMSDRDVMATAQQNLLEVKSNNFAPPERVIRYVRYNLLHVLRVACFTTSPTNFSMWANYAKHVDSEGNVSDHAGICIEYRCDESWRGSALHPVEYSDDLLEIDPVERDEGKFVKVLYRKSREWRGEEEWRISSVLQTSPPFEGNWQANCKIRVQGAVAAVIFGMNSPQEMIELVSARVKKAHPDITLKRVVRDPLTWVREVVPLVASNP